MCVNVPSKTKPVSWHIVSLECNKQIIQDNCILIWKNSYYHLGRGVEQMKFWYHDFKTRIWVQGIRYYGIETLKNLKLLVGIDFVSLIYFNFIDEAQLEFAPAQQSSGTEPLGSTGNTGISTIEIYIYKYIINVYII